MVTCNGPSTLQEIATLVRKKIIELSYKTKTPHLGSSLSCIEILVAAYWKWLNINPNDPLNRLRDRFILSKGHAVTSLYTVLAMKQFFPESLLEEFNQNGSCLPEHPSPHCVPGIEAATGSLGHGLALGIGHALAGKILKENYKVVVLLSDGECNEGSVWEAALFAPAHKLDNIIAIVDFNKWQATGKSEEIMSLTPLKEKWEAFGWNSYEVDGHDLNALCKIMEIPNESGKPIAIVAHTIKGKGVSFMENDNNWHYRIPSETDLLRAFEELRSQS